MDGLWLRVWPYQTFLPRHGAEEQPVEDVPGREPGLVDEAN